MSIKLKKCVSPCKGIVLNKCKLPFCSYVNKTRKYCTLNRKQYQLKNDERGCNIYPTKNKPIINFNKGNLKTNLINKLKQAKERIFTRKLQAFRTKRAEKTIKNFMMNPDVREKSTALFLRSICSKSGVCIAFDQETTKIKKFFNNFTDFTYLYGPIQKIGAVSNNGFIYELTYRRQKYYAYAILKSSVASYVDNLMYEYFVGNALNTFGKQLPCFVETYGLFEYATDAAWNKLKSSRPDKEYVLKTQLTLIPSPTFDDLKNGCSKPKLHCLLIQHLYNTEHLERWVKLNLGGNFINNELIPVLYIIYFSLATLSDKFTHYDLHAQNVLLYEPSMLGYIEYVFHEHIPGKAARLVKFKSKFIPKIIDYGRCFYSLNAQNNSSKIYDKLCTINECKPACGLNQGFQWLNSGDYDIMSRQKNNSHDLRLLKYLKEDVKKRKRVTQKIKDFFDSVVYSGRYGTPENSASGLPDKINNVSDALSKLSDMVMSKEPKTSDDKFLNPGYNYQSLGELHIYSDGQPMKFIKANI